LVEGFVAVESILGPLNGAHIPHSVTTNRALSHEIPEVPVCAAKNLTEIFCFQPLLVLSGIEPSCKKVKSRVQLTNVCDCCSTFISPNGKRF